MGGDEEAIRWHAEQGIATITIRRPRKANALRRDDKLLLARSITKAAADETIEGVVLTGAGDKSFCAGSDIAEMQGFDPTAMFEMLSVERAMYQAILDSPKPVVAAVNGIALGAGAILVMACDYAVAAESIQVGTPELSIGVSAPLEGLLLPLIVGLGRARSMYYRSRRLTAAEALEAGLVHEVVAPSECLPMAIDAARNMANLPGGGFAIQKRMLGLLISTGNLELAIESSHFATALQFAEPATGEAMRAFLARKHGTGANTRDQSTEPLTR